MKNQFLLSLLFLCAFISFAAENETTKFSTKRNFRHFDFSILNKSEQREALVVQNNELIKLDKEIRKLTRELKRFRNERIMLEGDVLKEGYKNNTLFAQNSRQKAFVALLGIVLVLGLGLVYVLFRSTRSKQKYLDLLKSEKNEVSKQKELVSAQKEETEKVLDDLMDSIRYALRIQNAVLPDPKFIADKLKKDYFVLYKPKDIVSGDFYFLVKKGDWLIAAAADCTGHGVPGGFLSMLSITMLNDVVLNKTELKASEVLDELREKIIYSMEQKGIQMDQNDGLDISLLMLNKREMKGQWAGANTPLIKMSLTDEVTLEEIMADKRPIGYYPNMNSFSNHEFTIKKKDRFYLLSDGYFDQFGGPNNKKFMKKRFKNMLIENGQYSMPEQREIFQESIEKWMTYDGVETPQVDDITIFGIEV